MSNIRAYHGTTESDAKKLINGSISVSHGGELGLGFYLGEMKHEAFAWAKKKGLRAKEPYAVVSFEMTEIDFFQFNILTFERQHALLWKCRE